ncbi:MAG: polysaccharide pyruvyl transferase family protein [Desulfocapsaceae bacterium]|nr:polysaccharide pyruvyl transferase family protein [Desulfocapsaceae bacterium]
MNSILVNQLPKTALFLDAYCASHVGNDVLLESSMALLRRICPDIEIKIHAKNPDSLKESQGVHCQRTLFYDVPLGRNKLVKIFWFVNAATFIGIQVLNAMTFRLPPYFLTFSANRRTALNDMTESDLVISIGGEMINDSFRKTLPMYLFMFWLAGKFGARVIIFPQSIGPLKRYWTRWLTAKVLKKCTIVTARDQPSFDELHSLGLGGNQALTSPDVGIEQPTATDEEAKKYLVGMGVTVEGDRTWIGVIPSAWVEEGVVKKNYLDTLVEAIQHLALKHKVGVVLMPANMPVHGNSSSDYNTAMRIYSRLQDNCPVYIMRREVVPAKLFKAITRCLTLVISTRMHAAILSTMAGTPTITINTQRKLYGYMERIGQQRFSIDIHDLSEHVLLKVVEEILNDQERVRSELRDGYHKVSVELKSYIKVVRPILGC